jgi:hypothetical protein
MPCKSGYYPYMGYCVNQNDPKDEYYDPNNGYMDTPFNDTKTPKTDTKSGFQLKHGVIIAAAIAGLYLVYRWVKNRNGRVTPSVVKVK